MIFLDGTADWKKTLSHRTENQVEADSMKIMIFSLFSGSSLIIACFDKSEPSNLSQRLAALRFWPARRQKSSGF
jgi:hypothetical protein